MSSLACKGMETQTAEGWNFFMSCISNDFGKEAQSDFVVN